MGSRGRIFNQDYEKSEHNFWKCEKFWGCRNNRKVKELQNERGTNDFEGQIIYTYLHLAATRELTEGLIKSRSICIAYETVTDDKGDYHY